jgi:hypothetical protein
LPIRPYTDTEWDSLPHVLLTADNEWDTKIIDYNFKEDEPWGDDAQFIKGNKYSSPFYDFGNYWHYAIVQYTDLFQQNDGSIDLDDNIDQCVYDSHQIFVEEDIVFLYDMHGNGNGYNDYYIQVPAIIPKITIKQEPDFDYEWSKTVYGDLKKLKSEDALEPLGISVTMSHYFDTNLMHDIMTGKSVTDILHLVNNPPLEWYSKKQPIIGTATNGSEINDLRANMRYLSVPIRNKSCMFVVDSSMQVSAKLHKCYTILSFHQVREYNASIMVGFYFSFGESNKSNILIKAWGNS